ncbi:hypothetical protein HGRIS_005132 [Hohenbuehelia grisea]|uniref:FAD-binding domain-containing protein n=1 Tax=Hohenbuehelia grisea TaxID=104357 RepID=A0ABR3JE17_9AGAR
MQQMSQLKTQPSLPRSTDNDVSPASVLIVGAGPAGLVLALALMKNGISVHVIDKAGKPCLGQRGAALMPRSLEVHELLGTLDDIQSLSTVLGPGRAYAVGGGSKVLKGFELFPYVEPTGAVSMPNPVILGHDTHTSILREHLARYGCHVEMSTELLSLEQHADGVRVCLSSEGRQMQTLFSYVVGTDGSRSTVRKQLGLSFLGETRSQGDWVVGDVYIDGLDPKFFHVWGEAASVMLVHRATERKGIFNFILAGDTLDHALLASSQEDLIEYFQTTTGRTDLQYGKFICVSHYKPNIRTVDEFGRGRVFVAGDAAHVHSPTGGQGMNSGILDSINLGWKLALSVKGIASKGLLESYNAERLPVIATMLQITTKIHGTMYKPGAQTASWDRSGSLHQLGVNYRGSPIVYHENPDKIDNANPYNPGSAAVLSAGDRAPDATGLQLLNGSGGSELRRLHQMLNPSRHTIFIFTTTPSDASAFADPALQYPSDAVRSVVIVPSANAPKFRNAGSVLSDVAVMEDLEESASGNYNITTATKAVVVRPDGFIGSIVEEAGSLQLYFECIFA